MSNNVIVAGAGGFLGRQLVKALKEKGYTVTALVTGKADTCADRHVHVKDMDMDELGKALKGKKYACFYDLAWKGTSGSIRGDEKTQTENIMLTCMYTTLAAQLGCKRFIYASSISEEETYAFVRSDGARPSPGYIYGTAKMAAGMMSKAVAVKNEMDFVSVMFTNVYGEGERSGRLISSTVQDLLKGKKCSFTEGRQTYDFIYITDAVSAVIAAAEKGRPFTRYYIGSGDPQPLRRFIEEIYEVLSPDTAPGFGDIPFNGVSLDYSMFDLKGIERDTGYKNKVSFRDGIKKTVETMRKEEQE